MRLRAGFPQVHILILSTLRHECYIGQLFDAGALGYVPKSPEKTEILMAIQTVITGRWFLCSDLGLNMLRKVLAKGDELDEAAKVNRLSRRKSEVLQLLSEDLTTN